MVKLLQLHFKTTFVLYLISIAFNKRLLLVISFGTLRNILNKKLRSWAFLTKLIKYKKKERPTKCKVYKRFVITLIFNSIMLISERARRL